MPCAVLTFANASQYIRYLRSSTITEMSSDYVMVQKAYGMKESGILFRHVLKNAMLPMITVLGMSLQSLVSGAIITEQVFAWPGIGQLAVTAVMQYDYPLIMGITMFTALLVVLGNLLAVAGAVAILLLALISIFAFLYPVDPNAISATERLNAPSMAHLFGTDDMGRDYLARCIYGGRASLLVGFLSMILSTALGVIVGSISGFVGGTVDAVLMRLVDALMSLPTFLIMIVMNAFLKPGLQNIVLIIGFLTWMNIARIVRGETISLNEREYVIYAKISGQKKFSTIVHHILPNIMPTIIVAATMNIANAILMESALSFFGLGIQPPTASWGSMLSNAQRYIQQAPYLAIFPGILILITVISFNYLGEVLRKVFEPK